jgi:hypothetical protein
MLVKMSVDARGDTGGVRRGLVRTCNVGLENPGELNLEFDGTVLIEIVVPYVFCRQYFRENQKSQGNRSYRNSRQCRPY